MPGWWRSRSFQNAPPRCAARRSQAAVVQRGLALLAGSRPAGRGRAGRRGGTGRSAPPGVRWPRRCAAPAARRRVRAEDPRLVQHPVEHDACAIGWRAASASASSSSRTSPTVMSAEQAALGAHDDRRAVQDVCLRAAAETCGSRVAQPAAAGRTRRVAGRRPCRGQLRRRASPPAANQRRRGPHDVGADQRPAAPLHSASSRALGDTGRGRAASAAGTCRQPRPRRRRRWPAIVPASCRPAGLPASPAAAPARGAGCFWLPALASTNGGAGQPAEHLARGSAGGRPAGRRPARAGNRARGGLLAPRAGAGDRRRPLRDGADGHDAPFPNSTSSVSGR